MPIIPSGSRSKNALLVVSAFFKLSAEHTAGLFHALFYSDLSAVLIINAESVCFFAVLLIVIPCKLLYN